MKHIAVVEDEDMMREELEAILQKAGYQTSGITDFENAAAAILAASPDLVLLDLNLPGMGDGWQTIPDEEADKLPFN